MNKLKSYMKIMIIPAIIGVVLLVWYRNTNSRFEQILIGFILFTILIPFVLQLLTMLLGGVTKDSKSTLYEQKGNENKYTIEPIKNIKNDSIKAPYKAKTNNNPIYVEVRDRFKSLVKNGDLGRNEILQFKSELDYKLSTHKYIYDTFTFENDAHEIYIKLKSSKLTTEDYVYLKGVIEDLI
jgi:hypothetical protein